MEKIYFDDMTYIWKTKLNLYDNKDEILEQAKIVVKSHTYIPNDGYGYIKIDNDVVLNKANCGNQSKLDEIIELSVNYCKEIYIENNEFNRLNMESWVNVVRAKNPVQSSYRDRERRGELSYHVHTDLNKDRDKFIPNYTYVYYIQMPDIMEENDGVLYFKSKNGRVYWVKPEVDDLIIMPADMPHSPNNAPKSTIDRMVLAGNVGFELIKKNKTII
jgi:hypothetical protein